MSIGDKKELTTEEIKTLSQEQFEAYVLWVIILVWFSYKYLL